MKKYSVLSLILVTLSIFFPLRAAQASEFSFIVDPILPESQRKGQLGYYDILLEPGGTQKLEVDLSNATDKEVKINVGMTSAKTNDNGVVEYSPNDLPLHASQEHDLEKLVDYKKVVTLAPKSKERYSFTVKMPQEEFPGIIAGGISFQEVDSDEKEKKDSEGMAIKNKFNFAVAVLMRQSEGISGTGELTLQKAEANQRNVRNVIRGYFSNDKPFYINNLAIDAAIYKEKDGKKVYSEKTENMQMAPNSGFWYNIPLQGEELEAGEYLYKGTAYGIKDKNGEFTFGKDNEGKPQNYQQKWEFEKKFTITQKAAQTYNKKDVDVLDAAPNYTWLYYLLGAIILLLILTILLLIRRKDKKKTDE